MHKPRIFIISKNFHTLMGGAERSMIEILRKKKLKKVFFKFSNSIIYNKKSEIPREWKYIKIKLIKIPKYFFYADFFFNLFLLLKIKKYIKRNDIIYCNGNYAPIHSFIECKKKIISIRSEGELGIYNNFYSVFSISYYLKFALQIFNFPIKFIWLKFLLKSLNNATFEVNSKYLIKEFKKKKVKNLKILYSEPIINKSIKKIYNKIKNKIPLRRKGIVMFGDNIYKGSNIFKKIAKKMPFEKFFLYDGKYKKSLRKNNILFMPWQNNINQYKFAKMVLVPSLCGEAFSRTAKECQILKIKLLVSDHAGLKYSVKNKNMRIANFKSPEDWVRKINKLNNQRL